MKQQSRISFFASIWFRLIMTTLLAITLVGCAEDAALLPAADAVAPALDDYQAQREDCTRETPCWPRLVDTIPATFSEAPMLAERVQAGDLPPWKNVCPLNRWLFNRLK
jgi:hypothetical protein